MMAAGTTVAGTSCQPQRGGHDDARGTAGPQARSASSAATAARWTWRRRARMGSACQATAVRRPWRRVRQRRVRMRGMCTRLRRRAGAPSPPRGPSANLGSCAFMMKLLNVCPSVLLKLKLLVFSPPAAAPVASTDDGRRVLAQQQELQQCLAQRTWTPSPICTRGQGLVHQRMLKLTHPATHQNHPIQT
ncbi:hypothetical protein SEVIR_4G096300v4 [Setaria viridis]|uniref:Uncharacterized protein n=2 Tax=Setaria TaxID=4554 RepID=A0A368QSN9_SETIT|nr:hypothetical protein SETIT_4G096900v2 [Setaria italica]TKW20556.1 hypothetical protein SEVIR_4G096300v2 [Setaria viridis]